MDLCKKNAILGLVLIGLFYCKHNQALVCNQGSNHSQIVSKLSSFNDGFTYTITVECRNSEAKIKWRKFQNENEPPIESTIFVRNLKEGEVLTLDAVLDPQNPQLKSYCLIQNGQELSLRQYQFITGKFLVTATKSPHITNSNIARIALYPQWLFEFSDENIPSTVISADDSVKLTSFKKSRNPPEGEAGFSSLTENFLGHYHSETGQAIYFTQDGKAYQKDFGADKIWEVNLDRTMLPSNHPLYKKSCENNLYAI